MPSADCEPETGDIAAFPGSPTWRSVGIRGLEPPVSRSQSGCLNQIWPYPDGAMLPDFPRIHRPGWWGWGCFHRLRRLGVFPRRRGPFVFAWHRFLPSDAWMFQVPPWTPCLGGSPRDLSCLRRFRDSCSAVELHRRYRQGRTRTGNPPFEFEVSEDDRNWENS